MYTVIGCDRCQTIWIVERKPVTVKCPRCGKRHKFTKLRKFAEEEDLEVVRAVRTRLLSDKRSNRSR